MSPRGVWDRERRPQYEPAYDPDDQDAYDQRQDAPRQYSPRQYTPRQSEQRQYDPRQDEQRQYDQQRYGRRDPNVRDGYRQYQPRRGGPRIYNYEGDDFSDRYNNESDPGARRDDGDTDNDNERNPQVESPGDQQEARPRPNRGINPDDQDRVTFDGGPRPYIAPLAPPKVSFVSSYEAGRVVIDTGRRALYYVIGSNQAFQYPISVGKEGFSWTGTEAVSRIAEWPDWYPPAEMRQRRPELPEKMTGGLRNPLGATAIYLGNTLYRIHGTNDPKSIGRAESSGCIRMLNQHALHFASLVHVGTKVTVVPSLGKNVVAAQ